MIARTEVQRIAPGSSRRVAGASPLVSVILPTHNRAALLGRAICSVMAQTYRNLELLIVDDASTDNTRGVVGSFGDTRIKYIRHSENLRAAAARNTALKQSSGELIAFMDDDDEWLIQKLESQVATLQGLPDEHGLLLSSYIRITPDRIYCVGGAGFISELDYSRGYMPNFSLIATPGWLLRRKCIEKAGVFDERLRSLDDWELGLRIADTTKIAVLDEPLWIQRQQRPRGTTMAANERLYGKDLDIIMSKHGTRWHPPVRSLHYALIGRCEAMYGDINQARHYLWQAIRSDHLNPKAWVLMIATLGGQRLMTAVVHLRRKVARIMRRLYGLVMPPRLPQST